MGEENKAAEMGLTEERLQELALFLAESYGQMLQDRGRLKAVIDKGVQPYSKEMAIQDLTAICINYDADHVQSSSISNVPERIAIMLDSGYVDKMQHKQEKEMADTVLEYAYLCWKVEIVEMAIRERMTPLQRGIFSRIFVNGKSYREIQRSYRKGSLYNMKIRKEKQEAVGTIKEELMLRSSADGLEHDRLIRLFKEYEESEGVLNG